MLLGTCYPPKQPSETYPVEINFAGDLVPGETIVGSTTTAKKMSDGSNASSDVLSGGDVVDGTWVKKRLIGGVPGERYRVQMKITTSGNNSYEHEADVPVVEV
jgi:hypothetical protein